MRKLAIALFYLPLVVPGRRQRISSLKLSVSDQADPAEGSLTKQIQEKFVDRRPQENAQLIAEQMAGLMADENFQHIVQRVSAQMSSNHPAVPSDGADTGESFVAESSSTKAPIPQALHDHIKALRDDPNFEQEVVRRAREFQAMLVEPEFLKESDRIARELTAAFQEEGAFEQQLEEATAAAAQSAPASSFAQLEFNPSTLSRQSSSRSASGKKYRPSLMSETRPDASRNLDESGLLPIEEMLAEGMDASDDAVADFFDQEFNPTAVALGLATLAALHPDAALAKGGEFGILEGRIVSLAHPTVMAAMYGASAWAGFTGWQWRRLREMGSEIQEFKDEKKKLQTQMDALEKSNQSVPGLLTTQLGELTKKLDDITDARKGMAKANFRDKHYQVGSVILGLGTAFAIEGPVNTFLRAQKLFPGPHLYAGAGVVVAWAMAASLVPQMQKGQDWARSAHIAFNVLALGLFTWQLPTGWEIMLKVIKFTKFP
jgi:hypothetical protein